MGRHVVAIEGTPTLLQGVRLKPGCLWLESERVVVNWNFDWAREPIGYASDLRRDEATNEVTMEISLLPEGEQILTDTKPDDSVQYQFTFFADQLVEEQVEATENDEAYRLITSARVRAVAIVPNPVWPKPSRKTQGP